MTRTFLHGNPLYCCVYVSMSPARRLKYITKSKEVKLGNPFFNIRYVNRNKVYNGVDTDMLCRDFNKKFNVK